MKKKLFCFIILFFLLSSCKYKSFDISKYSSDFNSPIEVIEEDDFIRMRFNAKDREHSKKISFLQKKEARNGENWDVAFSFTTIAINGGNENAWDKVFFPENFLKRTGNWKVAVVAKKFEEVSLDTIYGKGYYGNIIPNLVIKENKFKSDSLSFYAIENFLYSPDKDYKTWEFDEAQGIYNYEKVERMWAESLHEGHKFGGKEVSIRRVIPLEKTFIFKSNHKNPHYIKMEIEDFYKDKYPLIETYKESFLPDEIFYKFKGEGFFTIRYAFLN